MIISDEEFLESASWIVLDKDMIVLVLRLTL